MQSFLHTERGWKARSMKTSFDSCAAEGLCITLLHKDGSRGPNVASLLSTCHSQRASAVVSYACAGSMRDLTFQAEAASRRVSPNQSYANIWYFFIFDGCVR